MGPCCTKWPGGHELVDYRGWYSKIHCLPRGPPHFPFKYNFSMHERDDTKAFLRKVTRQFLESHLRHSVRIDIALGELSETDPVSFRNQWQELNKGTPAEHAQLHFRLIPAEVQCMACFQKYHPVEKKILCPSCGSFGAKILTGEECYLESIQIEHQ